MRKLNSIKGWAADYSLKKLLGRLRRFRRQRQRDHLLQALLPSWKGPKPQLETICDIFLLAHQMCGNRQQASVLCVMELAGRNGVSPLAVWEIGDLTGLPPRSVKILLEDLHARVIAAACWPQCPQVHPAMRDYYLTRPLQPAERAGANRFADPIDVLRLDPEELNRLSADDLKLLTIDALLQVMHDCLEKQEANLVATINAQELLLARRERLYENARRRVAETRECLASLSEELLKIRSAKRNPSDHSEQKQTGVQYLTWNELERRVMGIGHAPEHSTNGRHCVYWPREGASLP